MRYDKLVSVVYESHSTVRNISEFTENRLPIILREIRNQFLLAEVSNDGKLAICR